MIKKKKPKHKQTRKALIRELYHLKKGMSNSSGNYNKGRAAISVSQYWYFINICWA